MKERSSFRWLSEPITVTVLVVGSLAIIERLDWPGRWFLGPLVLIAGALVPMGLRHGGPTELGLRMGRFGQTVRLTGIAGVVLAGFGLLGMAVFASMGVELPLRASVPEGRWVQWILFQFLYVAVPEELFFRGYLMGGIMRSPGSLMGRSMLRPEHTAVLISAAVFALAHMLILGHTAAVVTFVPGLAFAWLFVRTGSLAGPILLHGVANIGYGLIGMRFA